MQLTNDNSRYRCLPKASVISKLLSMKIHREFNIENMNKLVCVLLSLLLMVLNVCCDTMTVRETSAGPVEGIAQTSSLGRKYVAFRGIPFAESPITGTDPYTGEQVDRRFKVRLREINIKIISLI